jgi:hypothetical protein
VITTSRPPGFKTAGARFMKFVHAFQLLIHRHAKRQKNAGRRMAFPSPWNPTADGGRQVFRCPKIPGPIQKDRRANFRAKRSSPATRNHASISCSVALDKSSIAVGPWVGSIRMSRVPTA